MGQHITLRADDGHMLQAYEAVPRQLVGGAIVVLQEIFGVNEHVRAVCDRLAGDGYVALAPALFDRFAPGFESGYTADEISAALKLLERIDWELLVLDTKAAVDHLRPHHPVALLGFCLGGSLAYLAATRIDDLAAAVGYYGGEIVRFADSAPRCPTLLHFGARDHTIALSDVEAIRAKRPECDIHVYDAGHGFNCDARASFEPQSAALAWQRTQALLDHVFSDAAPG